MGEERLHVVVATGHERGSDPGDSYLPDQHPAGPPASRVERYPSHVQGDRRRAGAIAGVAPAGDRDEAADVRDRAADERDLTGDARDLTGDERDDAADMRDRAADQRDVTGDRRDRAADERDLAAAHTEEVLSITGVASYAATRSSLARRAAASDRMRASQDRHAGARERTHAERDRNTAHADRGAGAGERVQSELDRNIALADRGASAQERDDSASLDTLTGVFQRGAGLAELDRDVARARAVGQPLAMAFVDVDYLDAVNSSLGHAAGERMLVEVAGTLRSHMRAYDLIMRYGDDEFVCALSGLHGPEVRDRLALVNKALGDAPEHGSVTVGVAELRSDDLREDLVARADAELYLARRKREKARR
jgi:diguanylate cyclase (GGDEF)-like protein